MGHQPIGFCAQKETISGDRERHGEVPCLTEFLPEFEPDQSSLN